MDNNIDNIPITDKAMSSGFDATKYEGFRIPIASVEKKEVIDYFPVNPATQQTEFNPAATAMKWVIEVVTKPLPELDVHGSATLKLVELQFADGTKKNITVKHQFNLQLFKNPTTGKEELTISKHPKAALWKYMRKMGCTKLSELIGKLATLTSKPSKKEGDERRYLEFVL